MAQKSFRVRFSFDANQEKDIIDLLDFLSERQTIAQFLSNAVRVALDGKERQNLEVPSLSESRQAFFES